MDWTLERIEQKRLEWLHKYADIPGKLDAVLAAEGKGVSINGRYYMAAMLGDVLITRKAVSGFKAKTCGFHYTVFINVEIEGLFSAAFDIRKYQYLVVDFLQGEDPMNTLNWERSNFITPGDWMQLVNEHAEEAEKVLAARESQELKDKAEVMYKRMALEIAKEE